MGQSNGRIESSVLQKAIVVCTPKTLLFMQTFRLLRSLVRAVIHRQKRDNAYEKVLRKKHLINDDSWTMSAPLEISDKIPIIIIKLQRYYCELLPPLIRIPFIL